MRNRKERATLPGTPIPVMLHLNITSNYQATEQRQPFPSGFCVQLATLRSLFQLTTIITTTHYHYQVSACHTPHKKCSFSWEPLHSNLPDRYLSTPAVFKNNYTLLSINSTILICQYVPHILVLWTTVYTQALTTSAQ